MPEVLRNVTRSGPRIKTPLVIHWGFLKNRDFSLRTAARHRGSEFLQTNNV